MGRFAILVIPVLAILDYQLTLAGAALAERRYRKHFRIPQFELNPFMQPAIAARKRVSRLHLVLVVLITGLVYVEGLLSGFESSFFAFLLAFVFGVYTAILGRHLSNFLTFRFLDRNPQEISGTVEITQAYVTRISQYNLLSVSLPLAVAAVFSPTPPVFGILCGVLGLFLGHSLWYWKARRQDALRRASGLTEPAQQRTPPAA
ncbi:MAG TPA: hypothetical protein VJ725_25260 [Thermoanaerobaculia bacterium]|nr:hypothetical protein [Thermoanaerobaculia bacterium]